MNRLNLSGYEVVRAQYFSTLQNPAMTISNGKLRFNTSCLKKFEDVEYVELLLNSVDRCVAIRPCEKGNPNAIHWGRLKEGRWCASTLGCRGLAKTLFDIMEWEEGLKYRFRGQFVEQGDNKLMLFELDEPEMIKIEEIVLPSKEEEAEGKTVKQMIYIFPPEWAGTFGQPITSIAQVGILQQEHYAGNWDVLRPAAEIKEMNTFTADGLNTLLHEAEEIMEDISIYQNNKLIFVRELIQNALDATKMQLYRTLSAYGFQFNEKTSPFDVERAYPNIFEEHAIMIHTDYSRETGKVYFSIRDKGIGISMDEFKRNILTTGRSWPERKEYQDEIKRMPEWLRPTGAFGIGLHTVFSVTDSLTIRTKSDSENKANEMTLYSGKKGGYAFCKKTNQTLQRGSEFSFSFLLTEELKEWVTGSNGGKLFLENVNDGIQKEIKKIMETWCVTPMVYGSIHWMSN